MMDLLLIALLFGDPSQGITIHAPDALRARMETTLTGLRAAEGISIDVRVYGAVNAPETMRLDQSGRLVIGSGEVTLKCLIEITRQQRLSEAIMVSAKGADEAAAAQLLGGEIRKKLSSWLRRDGR